MGDSMTANSGQIEEWEGEQGQHWVAEAERYDVMAVAFSIGSSWGTYAVVFSPMDEQSVSISHLRCWCSLANAPEGQGSNALSSWLRMLKCMDSSMASSTWC